MGSHCRIARISREFQFVTRANKWKKKKNFLLLHGNNCLPDRIGNQKKNLITQL